MINTLLVALFIGEEDDKFRDIVGPVSRPVVLRPFFAKLLSPLWEWGGIAFSFCCQIVAGVGLPVVILVTHTPLPALIGFSLIMLTSVAYALDVPLMAVLNFTAPFIYDSADQCLGRPASSWAPDWAYVWFVDCILGGLFSACSFGEWFPRNPEQTAPPGPPISLKNPARAAAVCSDNVKASGSTADPDSIAGDGTKSSTVDGDPELSPLAHCSALCGDPSNLMSKRARRRTGMSRSMSYPTICRLDEGLSSVR